MSTVLVIDDDMATNEVLSRIVYRMGHTAASAPTLEEGMAHLNADSYDLVMLDVYLPDGNGLEKIAEIRSADDAPEVIIISAFGNPDGAELAIRNGAWDYVMKPASTESIMLTIKRALAYRKEKRAAATPRLLQREEIIGSSPELHQTLERVARAATTNANVLIVGETGTGKELVARAIHRNSKRSGRRFVVVDCAALPESLVESTLFGHEKGAYTGADREREGLIKQADGGALFLDEIGELPLSSQKAFLRVIQEHRFRPVSGNREIEVDFRLIAATNRNLDQMVKQGRFRKDLLYRLRTFGIETPPLRQRKTDIKPLAVHHINRICEVYGMETKGISSAFFEALDQYSWPGNVRELFNALEEAISVAGNDPTLYCCHLPTRIRVAVVKHSVMAASPEHREPRDARRLDTLAKKDFQKISVFRNRMDRRYLERLTQLTNGNRKEACRISGLSRTRLFELLKKHNLSNGLRKKEGEAVPG